MHLYLVQHAVARSALEDPERGLAEEGLRQIERVAGLAPALGPVRILHSDKKRAQQTAEVLAERLKIKQTPLFAPGLRPGDDPWPWAERLARTQEDTMLVGHMPFMAALAGLLLAGDKNKPVVRFKNACITCLEKDETGTWSLLWMITPEIAE